jgi:GNAT superfamily N-acetyltransferase
VEYEKATRSKPAWGYVRTLTQQEEPPLLRDHLLRLDAESRHDRFNGFLDDSFIESYAGRCADDGTVIIAYIENGVVRGAAELHPPEQSPDSLPEIAFSVEASVRRKGVGTILCRRLIEEARAKGYKTLRITTGAENHAMRALAGKFGAHLAFRDGEFIGTIDLIRQSQAELAKLASASLRARPGIERGERGPMTDEYEPWYRDRSIVAGVHLVRNCNRVYWTLLPGMVGPSRAAA